VGWRLRFPRARGRVADVPVVAAADSSATRCPALVAPALDQNGRHALRVIHARRSLCQVYSERRRVYIKDGLFPERM
jgi:hypothetical protein